MLEPLWGKDDRISLIAPPVFLMAENELIAACCSGDLARVRSLLEAAAGASDDVVNHPAPAPLLTWMVNPMLWWEPKWFPLDFSIHYCHDEISCLLIEKGGRVNYPFHLDYQVPQAPFSH